MPLFKYFQASFILEGPKEVISDWMDKEDNIYEFTSSPLNRGIFPSYETDSLLLGKTYTQNNYGIVEFYEDSLNLFIKDENMKILESLEIPLK